MGISNDESLETTRRLDVVVSNTLIGLALIFICLLLFLNGRMALLTSLSMPLVVMGSLFAMQILGLTFNLISMLAIIIALGMLVDNSIVVSENIHRYHEDGLNEFDAAYKGTSTIFWPVTATVLTTIAAFAPMLVTTGVMGEFIFGIPVLVSAALLICLAESFLLLPSRIMIFHAEGKIKSEKDKSKSHWFDVLQKGFEKILTVAVKGRWLTLFLAFSLLIGSFLWARYQMDFILFPPEGVDKFVLRYEAPPGTPIEDVHQAVKSLEKEIATFPKTELRSFVTRTGIQQVSPDDPLSRVGPNLGMIILYLTPANERERSAADMIDELREKNKSHPILKNIQYQQLINGPPVGRPVTITILGQDLEKLKSLSQDVQNDLKTVPGVFDIDTDDKPGLKQITIKLFDNTTKDFGLTTTDVAFAIRTAHEGQIASTITEFGDEIDIRVLLSDQTRGEFDVLKKINVSDRRGNLIPLSQIASIDVLPGPGERRHLGFLRSITITADIDTQKNTSVAVNQDLKERYQNFEQEHPGFRLKFGGEDESTQESVQSLFAALIIAVLCIYAVLVTLFNSVVKPLIVMISIPFGFIGTIVGFSIHQKPLGFLALIGAIGLAGVVVNASIVMMSFIDDLKKEGRLSFFECLVKGTSLRLRPVLLTTITTVSALLPTAYGIGGWDPLLIPMTMALAWGLLFGTLLTLFIIPCSYGVLHDVKRLFRRKAKTPPLP